MATGAVLRIERCAPRQQRRVRVPLRALRYFGPDLAKAADSPRSQTLRCPAVAHQLTVKVPVLVAMPPGVVTPT